MTIASNYAILSAISSGSNMTLTVPISWDFDAPSELNVWIKDNTTDEYKYARLGEVVTNVPSDQLSVTITNPFVDGGGVYSEITAWVARVTPESQTYALINGQTLDPVALEAALDRAVRLIQEAIEGLPNGEQGYITSIDPFEIVAASLRGETVMYFDINGDPTFVNPNTLDSNGKIKVSVDDDIYDYLEGKVNMGRFEVISPIANQELIQIKDDGLTIAKVYTLQSELDSKATYTYVDGKFVELDLTQYNDLTTGADGYVYILEGGVPKKVLLSTLIAASLTYNSTYRMGFTDANLTAGVLTIPHSLNIESVDITVYDENDNEIKPDESTYIDDDTQTIDLSSYGTIAGNWRVLVLSGNGGGLGVPGEANDTTNVGSGIEIAKPKVGLDLPFRTLQSSDSTVDVSLNGDTVDLKVVIPPDTGEDNTASNVGSGTGLFNQKTGVDLEFKGLTSTDSSIHVEAGSDYVSLRAANNLITTSLSADRPLVASDAGHLMRNESVNNITLTINDAVFDANTLVIARQSNTGTVTIQAGAGVTINGVLAGSVEISGQYVDTMIHFISANTIEVIGGLV